MSPFRDVEPGMLARVTGGAPNPEMMMNVLMELSKGMAERSSPTMMLLRVMMIMKGLNPGSAAAPAKADAPGPAKAEPPKP